MDIDDGERAAPKSTGGQPGRSRRAAAGGKARAERLTPERRSEIASMGAKSRWKDRQKQEMPKVVGGFKNKIRIGGVEIPCAVIMGPNGIQRVLSATGITKAVLGGRSGASSEIAAQQDVPVFLAPSQLQRFISPEARALMQPIDYLDGSKVVRGYDAAILVEVCNVWLEAFDAGALKANQVDRAAKAGILVRALAKTGIMSLVDEATGYQSERPRDAIQAYLELVVRKELAVWLRKFPDEFYENIYRLKGWKWEGMGKNRYGVVANYTVNLIYDRMGPGITEELIRKSPMGENGRRPNMLHQWLSEDTGEPMFVNHMHTVIMLQRLALRSGHGWSKFLRSLDLVLPRRNQTMQLPLDD